MSGDVMWVAGRTHEWDGRRGGERAHDQPGVRHPQPRRQHPAVCTHPIPPRGSMHVSLADRGLGVGDCHIH
jgi:hypothetical protein